MFGKWLRRCKINFIAKNQFVSTFHSVLSFLYYSHRMEHFAMKVFRSVTMHVDNWYGLFRTTNYQHFPRSPTCKPKCPPPLKKSLGLKWKYWDFGRKSKRIIMVNGGWGGAPLFCSILRPFRLEENLRFDKMKLLEQGIDLPYQLQTGKKALSAMVEIFIYIFFIMRDFSAHF